MPTWLTADEATSYLGLPSKKALYERARRGQVPVHRLGRSLRFKQEELDAVIKSSVPLINVALGSPSRRPSAKEGG